MRHLTLYGFISLTDNEKINQLELNGVYLDVYRYKDGYKVALFALSNFYVEVWLDEKTDQIIRTNAFSSYKRLDLFIKQIDLTSIFEML